MILIWQPRCLNAWQMPPFIGQNSELLIWWLIVEWVATSWLRNTPYLLCLQKTSLLTSEFEHIVFMKVLWNCLSFLWKQESVHWTSRTRDIGWTLNSIWAAEQIPTSPMLLPFELENNTFKSWTLHENLRPLS